MNKLKIFKETLESFSYHHYTIKEKVAGKGYEIFTSEKLLGYLNLDNMPLPNEDEELQEDMFLNSFFALQGCVIKEIIDIEDAKGNDSPFMYLKHDPDYSVVGKAVEIEILKGCSLEQAINRYDSCISISLNYETVYDEDEVDEDATEAEKQKEIERIVKEIEKLDPENLLTVFEIKGDSDFENQLFVSITLDKDYFSIFRNEDEFDDFVVYYYPKEAERVFDRVKEIFKKDKA